MKYIAGLFFSIILLSCSQPKTARYNAAASLHDTLLLHPHEWRVITSTVQKSTMSTLYGNEPAATAARKGSTEYPAGALLTLITWNQQPDDHWFSAVIPGAVVTVEQVQFPVDNISPVYKKYLGNALTSQQVNDAEAKNRIDYITRQRASVMP